MFTKNDIIIYAGDEGTFNRGAELAEKNNYDKLLMSVDETALSGECKGSGSSVYQCSVDMGNPAKPKGQCNCPSRQKPCKHIIGLLICKLTEKTFDVTDTLISTVKPTTKKKTTSKSIIKQEETKEILPPIVVGGDKVVLADWWWDEDDEEDEEFSIRNLTTLPEPPVIEAQSSGEYKDVKLLIKNDDLYDVYWNHNHSEEAVKKRVERVLGEKDKEDISVWDLTDILKDYLTWLKDIPAIGEFYTRAAGIVSPKTFKEFTGRAFREMLRYTVDKKDIEGVTLLYSLGARIVDEKDYDSHPMVNNFISEYKKYNDPHKVKEIFDTYLKEQAKITAPKIADGIKECIEVAKRKAKESGSEEIFPENVFGFYIYCSSSDQTIRLDNASKEGNELEVETKGFKSVSTSLIMEYLRGELLPLIEEMDRDGVFDNLRHDLFTIRYIYGSKEEIFFRKKYDKYEESKKAFDKILHKMETSENWKETVLLADDVIRILLCGFYDKSDPDRALAITLRHFFSLDQEAEFKGYQIFKEYNEDYAKWGYEYALAMEKNGHFDLALRAAMRSRRKNYEPSVQLHKRLKVEYNERALRKGTAYTEDSSYGPDPKLIAQVFTPEELVIKTDNIVAKADYQGTVIIRFLIECEDGYREALDFLNRIMAKGYSRLQGGYYLIVCFAYKTEYIKGVNIPKNSNHAFFARAVRYPNLRDKITEYIDHVMRRYHWYRDMDGEDSAMPGFFAAIALLMTDKKYLYLAGELASSCDSDHMDLQRKLVAPIAKRWPEEPDMFEAVYRISGTVYEYRRFGIPKGMFENINTAKAYLKAYESNLCNDIEDVANMFINRSKKTSLMLLKEMINQVESNEDKNVYIKLHNYLLNHNNEDKAPKNGEEIPLLKVEVKEEDLKVKQNPEIILNSDLQTFLDATKVSDNNPAVITKNEAAQAGVDLDDTDEIEALNIVVFSPAIISDPKILDYFYRDSYSPSNKRRDGIFYHRGVEAFLLGDYYIDLAKMEYEYGIVICDGQNRPYVLYGIYDEGTVQLALVSGQLTNPGKIEEIRKQTIIQISDKKILTNDLIPLEEKVERLHHAYAVHWLYRTVEVAKQIKPEHGKAYEAALLFRAYAEEKRDNLLEVIRIYQELIRLQPENKKYYTQKMSL